MLETMIFVLGLTAVWTLPTVWLGESEYEAINLEETILIPMFLFLSKPDIMLSVILASALTSIILNRPWYKFLFNATQLSIAALIGSLFATSLGGAIVGAFVYNGLTAFFVWSLFTFVLKTSWKFDPLFRGVFIVTAAISGAFMTTRLDMFPVIASIALLIQLSYSHIYSLEKERIPALSSVE